MRSYFLYRFTTQWNNQRNPFFQRKTVTGVPISGHDTHWAKGSPPKPGQKVAPEQAAIEVMGIKESDLSTKFSGNIICQVSIISTDQHANPLMTVYLVKKINGIHDFP